MTEDKVLEMIERNPIVIKNIENPSEEMKFRAIEKDGVMIRYIKNKPLQVGVKGVILCQP